MFLHGVKHVQGSHAILKVLKKVSHVKLVFTTLKKYCVWLDVHKV